MLVEMDSPWKILGREVIASTPVFDLRRDRKARHATPDQPRDFYVLEAGDWVNVIPITPDKDVVFIELFRQGIDAWSLEVPGGMIDPEDDSPRVAAGRELREETGYDSDSLVEIGVVEPNPAIQANQCFSFLAPDAFVAGPQQLDPGEDIRVVLHPLERVPELFREGRIRHSLVVAAFYWLDRFQAR